MDSKFLTVGVLDMSAQVLASMVDTGQRDGTARSDVVSQYRIVSGTRLCHIESIASHGDLVVVGMSFGPDRWVSTFDADETVWVA